MYTMQIGAGNLEGMMSYRWRDEVDAIANNDDFGHLDSLDDLSVTLSYVWADDRYRVTAFGRNITDERERTILRIGGLTSAGFWNEGKTYGVELSASF